MATENKTATATGSQRFYIDEYTSSGIERECITKDEYVRLTIRNAKEGFAEERLYKEEGVVYGIEASQ